jgi:hypothetical protein
VLAGEGLAEVGEPRGELVEEGWSAGLGHLAADEVELQAGISGDLGAAAEVSLGGEGATSYGPLALVDAEHVEAIVGRGVVERGEERQGVRGFGVGLPEGLVARGGPRWLRRPGLRVHGVLNVPVAVARPLAADRAALFTVRGISVQRILVANDDEKNHRPGTESLPRPRPGSGLLHRGSARGGRPKGQVATRRVMSVG